MFRQAQLTKGQQIGILIAHQAGHKFFEISIKVATFFERWLVLSPGKRIYAVAISITAGTTIKTTKIIRLVITSCRNIPMLNKRVKIGEAATIGIT